MGVSADTSAEFFGEHGSKPHGGWLMRFFLIIVGHGRGANDHQVTTGTSVSNKLLPHVAFMLPRLTIVNNGANTINIGYNGQPSFPLPAGAWYSATWKNPVESGLCWNDLGSAATVDVIS